MVLTAAIDGISTVIFQQLLQRGLSEEQQHEARTLSSTESHVEAIPAWRLMMSALGPFILLAISYKMALGMEKKIVVGLVRSSMQLLFLGYVLLGFIFSFKSPWIVFLYLTVMILIAALEATGRQVRTYAGHYQTSLLACVLGGGVTGLYAALMVFHPSPWWSAKVLIPTAGMIIGNSVSGPAVATERLLSEVMDKTHEAETRLAFGSSAYESILPMVRAAVQAALLPTFNQMAIMGLVSIPGMMTGQLLGGTEPLTAAEYQIAILYLIVTTSSISTFVSILLTIRKAVFDHEHRLTKWKITKGSKTEIDVALYQLLKNSTTLVVLWCSKSTPSPPRHNIGTDQYNPLPVGDMEEEVIELSLRKSSSLMIEVDDKRPDIEHQSTTANGEEIIYFDVTDSYNLMDGRVNYQIVPVTPEPGMNGFDNPSQLSHPYVPMSDLLFMAALNVKSGDETKLFHGHGLNLVLRVGERVTLEGPSGIGKVIFS
jgi:putative ABC transport system permease protein